MKDRVKWHSVLHPRQPRHPRQLWCISKTPSHGEEELVAPSSLFQEMPKTSHQEVPDVNIEIDVAVIMSQMLLTRSSIVWPKAHDRGEGSSKAIDTVVLPNRKVLDRGDVRNDVLEAL